MRVRVTHEVFDTPCNGVTVNLNWDGEFTPEMTAHAVAAVALLNRPATDLIILSGLPEAAGPGVAEILRTDYRWAVAISQGGFFRVVQGTDLHPTGKSGPLPYPIGELPPY